MPASFPDDRATMFDVRSGVTSNPLDSDQPGNATTGALATGIGFGPNVGPGGFEPGTYPDGYEPGKTDTDGVTTVADGTLMYIGGGASKRHNDGEGEANAQPVIADFGFGVAAGSTVERDWAADLAVVTAAQDTADGVELDSVNAPDYLNLSGAQVKTGLQQFGVNSDAPA